MPVAKKLYIILSALFLTAVLGLVIVVIRYNQIFNVTEANAESRRRLNDAIITFFGLALMLLSGAIYIVLYNFGRRKKAEKALQESKNLVGLLVSHVKDYAIFMIDVDGTVLSWNEGAEQ